MRILTIGHQEMINIGLSSISFQNGKIFICYKILMFPITNLSLPCFSLIHYKNLLI